MQTSGTVAQTQINVATLIDTAFRRAGKQPSTVSGELLQGALNALYFLTAEFVNKGVNLFCVRKNILNVRAFTAAYSQSLGTDDILNALYRRLQWLPGSDISGPDYRGIILDTPNAIANVSGTFDVAGYTEMVVEYDQFHTGVWLPLVSFGPANVDAGSDFASDIQRPIVAIGWRIRDVSGNAIVPNAVSFRLIRSEINMSQLNRDDYVNLPDKTRVGDNALQYWYDKQIDPVMYVWPISNRTEDQIVVYQHGQIEDIGKMSNSLAVPPRWYEAVIFTLAQRMCLEIPPKELPPGRLEMMTALAEQFTEQAGRGESDGSSYRLTPRIGGYTA